MTYITPARKYPNMVPLGRKNKNIGATGHIHNDIGHMVPLGSIGLHTNIGHMVPPYISSVT